VNRAGLKTFENAGVKIAHMTTKENAKWVETLSPIQDAWAKTMEAKVFQGEKSFRRLKGSINNWAE